MIPIGDLTDITLAIEDTDDNDDNDDNDGNDGFFPVFLASPDALEVIVVSSFLPYLSLALT